MHAQNVYHKVLEMESTSILNILALLLFENKQCIYSESGLNDTHYKDVKWGVGVESTSFHGFVNDESIWNVFWCLQCIFYCRTTPILKTQGQFENLVFVIMSTRENIRLIACAPLFPGYNTIFKSSIFGISWFLFWVDYICRAQKIHLSTLCTVTLTHREHPYEMLNYASSNHCLHCLRR